MRWVRHMRRTPYESAAAPTSHSAADPAEFNVRCRSKSNLPNRTDSNAALLPYLTHHLGSASPASKRCIFAILLFTSRKINLDFCSAFEIRLLIESSVVYQAKTNDLFEYQTMRTTEVWFFFFLESTSWEYYVKSIMWEEWLTEITQNVLV